MPLVGSTGRDKSNRASWLEYGRRHKPKHTRSVQPFSQAATMVLALPVGGARSVAARRQASKSGTSAPAATAALPVATRQAGPQCSSPSGSGCQPFGQQQQQQHHNNRARGGATCSQSATASPVMAQLPNRLQAEFTPRWGRIARRETSGVHLAQLATEVAHFPCPAGAHRNRTHGGVDCGR